MQAKNEAISSGINQVTNTIMNVLEDKWRREEAREQAARYERQQEEARQEQERLAAEQKRAQAELEAWHRKTVEELERKQKLAEANSTAGSLYDSSDTTQTASAEPRESLLSRTADLYADMKQKASDVRAEARNTAQEIHSAIKERMSELRQTAQVIIDKPGEIIRQKIESLPEDKRWNFEVYYYTFVNPRTNMITRFGSAMHVGAYFEAMVGRKLDAFFGIKAEGE